MISMSKYCLELYVTDQGTPYYPTVGTVETPSSDNAGYDLKVVVDQGYTPNATLVPLGVKARLVRYYHMNEHPMNAPPPGDCHFSLEPRSSIYKAGFMMANTRGIIDKSYRGELMAPMISVGTQQKTLEAGTRLFQIIAPDMGHIAQVKYVSSLPETQRGAGGFGSTGLK